MRGFKPGPGALFALVLAMGACSPAEGESMAARGETLMPDTRPSADQERQTLDPESVSGLWALHTSDRPDAKGCRIALQKVGQDDVYGVYLEGCEGTVLARVTGWRIQDGEVLLLEGGGEPVLRFRRTGMDGMEANAGGVTYRLEPAAMM